MTEIMSEQLEALGLDRDMIYPERSVLGYVVETGEDIVTTKAEFLEDLASREKDLENLLTIYSALKRVKKRE